MSEILLKAIGVRKYFPIKGGISGRTLGYVHAVDDVNLTIYKGETVGVVGESGCGKTTLGRVILDLIEPTTGALFYKPDEASVNQLEGLYTELTANGARELKKEEKKILGTTKDNIYKSRSKRKDFRSRVQIVFQDPVSSLDPRMLIKDVIAEPIRINGVPKEDGTNDGTGARVRLRGEVANKYVLDIVTEMGLNEDHLYRFPHEFSGGQRQRIAIARAIAVKPEFIVLDEPTSALDVSVQAQILSLLKNLQKKYNVTYMFITHNLAVIRAVSNRVIVMYLGKIVEEALTDELFEFPIHPYTQALISAIPIPDPTFKRQRLVLSGDVPSPANPPSGCRFHTRCRFAKEICSTEEPKLKEIRAGHIVACHFAEEILKTETSSSGIKKTRETAK
ncbi:MAG: ATP-binding cassette domain-containing protein [Candidatus Thermoplasmatota archaeon]|jgi:oligopeptide/dipeptide ABC transporter ATP-binding protein|nr:ATP-binding cassette domain-containing protein [Candidatus Thermoplasmatota archaeon]